MMKQVLVVGLTCLDNVNFCDKYPEEDKDVRVISQRWVKGGNAANTACVLAQYCGVKVHLLSGFSGKIEHSFVIEQVKSFGINIDLCPIYKTKFFPTTSCIISKQSGSRTILNSPNGFPTLKLELIQKADISMYDWIHFEGRDLKEVGKMIDYVLEERIALKTGRKPVISGEMEKVKYLTQLEEYLMSKVDVLFVSKDIATFKSLSSPLETVKHFSQLSSKAKYVVCAWGDRGAAVAAKCETGEFQYFEAEATRVDVVDSLGAGDTFIAGFIHSLINGNNAKHAIQHACDIAGRKCGQIGFDNLVCQSTDERDEVEPETTN